MFDQLTGGMEGTIPCCTLFFSLGGSSQRCNKVINIKYVFEFTAKTEIHTFIKNGQTLPEHKISPPQAIHIEKG